MRNYILLLAILLSSCKQSAENFNLDFEEINAGKPSGWTLADNRSQQNGYKSMLDSNTTQHGKYSLSLEKIDNTAPYGTFFLKIPKKFSAKSIELRGFVKTKDVEDGFASLWLRLDGEGKILGFDNMADRGITKTTDWKEFSIRLPYNSEVKSIVFGGLLTGNGKAWFDNFRIFMDGEPVGTAQVMKPTKAELDTAFNNHSGVAPIAINEQTIKHLAIIGQFWGFLKYHHEAAGSGEYNWDAELFKLLPGALKAKDIKDLSDSLENYLDRLPVQSKCYNCKVFQNVKEIDYGFLLDSKTLSQSLQKKLHYIKDNKKGNENHWIGLAFAKNPNFKNEKGYFHMKPNDTGLKLLCLYRYWTMINYFFPAKHKIGKDWNSILNDFIPIYLNANNKREYTLATLKLIASVHDTHANIWQENKTLDSIKGMFKAPFQSDFVENKLVITGFYRQKSTNNNQQLRLGDIIESINGKKVSELINTYLPITPASNFETKLRDLPKNFLLRSNDSVMKLKIFRDKMLINQVVNLIPIQTRFLIEKKKSYQLLNKDIGYVFAGSYKNKEVLEMIKTLQNTKGLILDMREYPLEPMYRSFINYLKPNTSIFAKLSKVDLNHPGLFKITTDQNGGVYDYPSVYQGKIIVLVDSHTQSQGEYTTMAFQSVKNVKVLGSQTAGADGDVSEIILPGGISTYISGSEIFYPDNTPTQRIGVRIDIPMKPTILGIKQGKDELLEHAKTILMSNMNKL